jgi:hypothetical protein
MSTIARFTQVGGSEIIFIIWGSLVSSSERQIRKDSSMSGGSTFWVHARETREINHDEFNGVFQGYLQWVQKISKVFKTTSDNQDFSYLLVDCHFIRRGWRMYFRTDDTIWCQGPATLSEANLQISKWKGRFERWRWGLRWKDSVDRNVGPSRRTLSCDNETAWFNVCFCDYEI